MSGRGTGRGRPLELLQVFLRLGLTSFGGPAAHLAYFRAEFVERRSWLSERAYADLVALSQFLPGPASSQTCVAIGIMRGGYLGGLAAWVGFTLPSATLLLMFACGAGNMAASPLGASVLHGLKLVAVAIVAQAVSGMSRSSCPDRQRATIALLALVAALLLPGSLSQLATIATGGLAGFAFCRTGVEVGPEALPVRVSRTVAAGCLGAFFALLVVSFLPTSDPAVALFAAFYRAGALVFGGGHVVLPLLHDAVVGPGWTTDSIFLAGYGAAQAVPGPLFTFAGYLGAVANVPPGGVVGAVIALVGIFVPGVLVLMGTLPFWHALRLRPAAQAAMRGVNAAVVGLLGAALYRPMWTSTVLTTADFAVAAAGFVLLVVWRMPPLLVVALSGGAGAAFGAAP